MDSALLAPNFSAVPSDAHVVKPNQYRKYSRVVKNEVAKTKNIYLFPDLKIPRTTAQYWVKKHRTSDSSNVIEIESVYKRKSEFLENELQKEKSMRKLLETVRKVFPYDFRTKHLKNKQSRAQIVAAIQEAAKFHKITHCLDTIGLSKSSYRRWVSEISFCNKVRSPCDRRRASQLTEAEVEIMKRFVTSKKYAHISVSSLHLLAQRTGTLFCSLETWYKYIRNFEWKRPWIKPKKKYRKSGIRSQKPNEIWHIDVTEVPIGHGVKFYIQAVIDNFSRYVLAWNITDKISANSTVKTLSMAKLKVSALLNTQENPNVMMDPGKENNNHAVQKFIASKNLKRVLAQVDVHYSNSMIEGLFHGLKNKYLYHQRIKNIEDLIRKANFYFKQHNEVVPLQVLNGGRPKEVFVSSWSDEDKKNLESNKLHAFLSRKKKNLEPPCSTCPV